MISCKNGEEFPVVIYLRLGRIWEALERITPSLRSAGSTAEKSKVSKYLECFFSAQKNTQKSYIAGRITSSLRSAAGSTAEKTKM